jgi:hypothetical protein
MPREVHDGPWVGWLRRVGGRGPSVKVLLINGKRWLYASDHPPPGTTEAAQRGNRTRSAQR